jgi:HSP20 family protein
MAQLPVRRNQGGQLATRREHPLARLQRDFDNLFGRLWGGWAVPFEQDFEPLRVWDFDVREDDKGFVVRAEMPGFTENEIQVQLNNNVLTIRAEKEQHEGGMEEYRDFERSVTLPQGTNAEGAQATYHNGVLELHIPRAPESQPRRITVQGHQAAAGQQPQQTAKPAGQQTQQAAGQGGTPAAEKREKK